MRHGTLFLVKFFCQTKKLCVRLLSPIKITPSVVPNYPLMLKDPQMQNKNSTDLPLRSSDLPSYAVVHGDASTQPLMTRSDKSTHQVPSYTQCFFRSFQHMLAYLFPSILNVVG